MLPIHNLQRFGHGFPIVVSFATRQLLNLEKFRLRYSFFENLFILPDIYFELGIEKGVSPLKKKLHLENARPQLWSTIAFKMDLDQKERRPFNVITFRMHLDRMYDAPYFFF